MTWFLFLSFIHAHPTSTCDTASIPTWVLKLTPSQKVLTEDNGEGLCESVFTVKKNKKAGWGIQRWTAWGAMTPSGLKGQGGGLVFARTHGAGIEEGTAWSKTWPLPYDTIRSRETAGREIPYPLFPPAGLLLESHVGWIHGAARVQRNSSNQWWSPGFQALSRADKDSQRVPGSREGKRG